MVDLTPETRAQLSEDSTLELEIDEDEGVLILRVMNGTPAEQANLQKGDVIHKVNGTDVTSASEVQEQVEQSRIGDLLEIEINRAGEPLVIELRPTTLPVEEFG